MWGMFIHTARLFLKGSLFRDPRHVARQWAIGFVAAFVALVVLVKIGLPLWLVLLLVVPGIGALQPWLFRNLKYK
jgi:uncharacterized protein (DUF983 family)